MDNNSLDIDFNNSLDIDFNNSLDIDDFLNEQNLYDAIEEDIDVQAADAAAILATTEMSELSNNIQPGDRELISSTLKKKLGMVVGKSLDAVLKAVEEKKSPHQFKSAQLQLSKNLKNKIFQTTIDNSTGRTHGEKPKKKWKQRLSFDDLSRDDLMLVYNTINRMFKVRRKLYYSDYRPIRKKITNRNRGSDGNIKWTKNTYKAIINEVYKNSLLKAELEQNKEQFLQQINETQNKNVYNEIYSSCFIYQLGSIRGGPEGTKTFSSREIDNQYTGRPGDAPQLFLTDLFNKHPIIFNRYIYNTKKLSEGETGKFNVVMRILRKFTGAVNPKRIKYKNNNCWFKYRLQGNIINDEKGIRIDHKTLKESGADPNKKRQSCPKYKTDRVSCVPESRRIAFKNLQDVRGKLKRKVDGEIATSLVRRVRHKSSNKKRPKRPKRPKTKKRIILKSRSKNISHKVLNEVITTDPKILIEKYEKSPANIQLQATYELAEFSPVLAKAIVQKDRKNIKKAQESLQIQNKEIENEQNAINFLEVFNLMRSLDFDNFRNIVNKKSNREFIEKMLKDENVGFYAKNGKNDMKELIKLANMKNTSTNEDRYLDIMYEGAIANLDGQQFSGMGGQYKPFEEVNLNQSNRYISQIMDFWQEK